MNANAIVAGGAAVGFAVAISGTTFGNLKFKLNKIVVDRNIRIILAMIQRFMTFKEENFRLAGKIEGTFWNVISWYGLASSWSNG